MTHAADDINNVIIENVYSSYSCHFPQDNKQFYFSLNKINKLYWPAYESKSSYGPNKTMSITRKYFAEVSFDSDYPSVIDTMLDSCDIVENINLDWL